MQRQERFASTMGRHPGLGTVVLMSVLTLAPATNAETVDARLERMRAHLASCTGEYGFDPKSPGNAGEHEVSRAEERWRECAYEGIRQIMMPGSAAPNAYRYLIAFDQMLTEEVKSGHVSRDERQARVRKAIDDALARNAAAGDPDRAAARETEAEKLDELRDDAVARQNDIRNMRRIQSMMQR